MRKELIVAVLNCILQDVKDRAFVSAANRCINSMNQEYKTDKDIQLLLHVLSKVLDENIIDKNEVMYEISQTEFSDEVKVNINDDSFYTASFRKDLLDTINAISVRSKVENTVTTLQDSLNTIEYASNSKKTVDAMRTFMQASDELYKQVNMIKIGSASSNVLIIDPDAETTHGTLTPVLVDMRKAVTHRIKTIPAIDMLCGGGFTGKTCILFGAYTGSGKSMILQNIALYTSKRNRCDIINEEYKPCVLYISLELTRKQLMVRHLQWCGISIDEEEMKRMTDEDIERLVLETNKKSGLQLPIVYIERLTGDYYTTINEVDDEFNNCVNLGFMPIMVLIDYVDRLEVYSSKHQQLGTTGADGAALLRQKVKECRDLAVHKSVPVLTAAQLSGEVGNIIGECAKWPRQVDPVLNFSPGLLAGSKLLSTELELMIFCHKTSIEERNEETDQITYQNFMSMGVKKDRDGTARYNRSPRDMDNETMYVHYTKGLRNSGPVRTLIPNSSEIHVVMPLDKFRIREDDYGRSIRMFYLSDDNTMSYEPFNMDNNTTLDEYVLDTELEEDELNKKLRSI